MLLITSTILSKLIVDINSISKGKWRLPIYRPPTILDLDLRDISRLTNFHDLLLCIRICLPKDDVFNFQPNSKTRPVLNILFILFSKIMHFLLLIMSKKKAHRQLIRHRGKDHMSLKRVTNLKDKVKRQIKMRKEGKKRKEFEIEIQTMKCQDFKSSFITSGI